uniref:Uncharacterized protein n=1 Tax=Anguilla anguilla TaxID=7936 RepID=A0A0E9Q308_ANGAN
MTGLVYTLFFPLLSENEMNKCVLLLLILTLIQLTFINCSFYRSISSLFTTE